MISETPNPEQEVKHTPLPWKIIHKVKWEMYSIQDTQQETDNIDNSVAGVWVGSRLDKECKANSEFILEACNNYYSLKEQLSNYETSYNNQCKRVDGLQEEKDRVTELTTHWLSDRDLTIEARNNTIEDLNRKVTGLQTKRKNLLDVVRYSLKEKRLLQEENKELTAANKIVQEANDLFDKENDRLQEENERLKKELSDTKANLQSEQVNQEK